MMKLFEKDHSDCCFENQLERQGAKSRSQEVKRQEGWWSGYSDGLGSSYIRKAGEMRCIIGLGVGEQERNQTSFLDTAQSN